MSTIDLISMESLYYDTDQRVTAEELGKLLLAVSGLALSLDKILPMLAGSDDPIRVHSYAAPITVGSPLDLKFWLEVATRSTPEGKKLHDGIVTMLGLRNLSKTKPKFAALIVIAILVGGGWALKSNFGEMSTSERKDRTEAIKLEVHNSTLMIGNELNARPEEVQVLVDKISKKHGRQLASTAVKLAKPGLGDTNLTMKVGGIYTISKEAVQAIPKQLKPSEADKSKSDSLTAEPCLMIRMNRENGTKGWAVEIKSRNIRVPAEVAAGLDLNGLIRRDEVRLDLTLESEWVENKGEYKPKKAYITGFADNN